MSNLFVDTAVTVQRVLHSGLSDVLCMSSRPLVMLNTFFPENYPSLSIFRSGGIFLGIMSTGSLTLMSASLGVLLKEGILKLGRLVAHAYYLEAIAQLPGLLRPFGGAVPWHYPCSGTGLATLLFQLPFPLLFAWNIRLPSAFPTDRYVLLALATCCRFMSATLADAGGAGSRILYWLAVPFLVFGVIPKQVWLLIGKFAEKCARIAGRVLSNISSGVYAILHLVLPKIRDFVVATLQHPFTQAFYNRVVVPLWSMSTPWVLPAMTAAIAVTCGAAVKEKVAAGSATLGQDTLLLGLGQVFCGVTAALSSSVLASHAGYQLLGRQRADPLRQPQVVATLGGLAHTISVPWRLARWLITTVTAPVARIFGKFFAHAFKFAVTVPVLSIPLVLLTNVMVIRAVYFRQTQFPLPSFSLSQVVADPTFAVLLIAGSQILAYSMVSNILTKVQSVRHVATGSALSEEELVDIAVTMAEPRMCGSCNFGPVDSRGCSDLAAHHGEVTAGRGGGRGRVSNACPRCGWFARSASLWPRWDSSIHTSAGRAVFRQRAWSEMVLVLRAASKALVIPTAMLHLGKALGLGPSVSTYLALSYLLPWAVENAKAMSALMAPPPRSARTAVPEASGAPPAGDDADCGAERPQGALPNITESEALRNILSAVPDRVFLAGGEVCSVCLDAFPEEAPDIATFQRGADAVQALRSLMPPVVALRCGHPLHAECAESAVAAGARSSNQHVRCPLCREPATVAGAASARMFS